MQTKKMKKPQQDVGLHLVRHLRENGERVIRKSLPEVFKSLI
jgi:hypothetical protein